LSDIWSCGVILYALLSGNLPFDDENIRRLLAKVKTGKFFMPTHISPLAQDLINRMLQIEPCDRISMQGIVKHSWFNLVPPQMELQKPVAEVIQRQMAVAGQAKDLDADILKSLELLGWTEIEPLQASLLSNEPSSEKVFYQLLYQRKLEYIQNYVDDDSDEEDTIGLPKRRAESVANLTLERKKFSNSENTSTQALSNPITPMIGSLNALHMSSDRAASGGSGSFQPNESSASVFSGKNKNELSVVIPAAKSKDELNQSLKVADSGPSSGPTTPKFHRKKFEKSELNVSTPILATPKRSWFASLFNFKPDSVSVSSTLSSADTLGKLRDALTAINVKVQDGRRGGLKCKLDLPMNGSDVGASSTMKPLKFRVDVHDRVSLGEAGCELVFSFQQGTMTDMMSIVDQIVSDVFSKTLVYPKGPSSAVRA
jgi:serine/threonine protein kinase